MVAEVIDRIGFMVWLPQNYDFSAIQPNIQDDFDRHHGIIMGKTNDIAASRCQEAVFFLSIKEVSKLFGTKTRHNFAARAIMLTFINEI